MSPASERYGRKLSSSRWGYAILFCAAIFVALLIVSPFLPPPKAKRATESKAKSVKIDVDPELIRLAAPTPRKTLEWHFGQLILGGILLTAWLALYLFFPRTSIHERGIRRTYWFRAGRWIPFEDIAHIVLFATQQSALEEREPGLGLILRDGSRIYISFNNYRQTHIMRKSLRQAIDIGGYQLEISPGLSADQSVSWLEERVSLRSSTFLSTPFLISAAVFAFFFFVPDGRDGKSALLVIAPLLYLLAAWQLFYPVFELDRLIFKNSFLPGYKKSIAISSICYYRHSSFRKVSDGMEISLYDGRSYFFHCGSLRDRHWKEFEARLTDAGIQRLPVLEKAGN